MFCNSTAAGQSLCLVKPYNYLHRFPSDGHLQGGTSTVKSSRNATIKVDALNATSLPKQVCVYTYIHSTACVYIYIIVSIACFAPRLWPVWQEALEQALKLCRPKSDRKNKISAPNNSQLETPQCLQLFVKNCANSCYTLLAHFQECTNPLATTV